MSGYQRKNVSILFIFALFMFGGCFFISNKFDIISKYYTLFIVLVSIIGLFLGFQVNSAFGDLICSLTLETSRGFGALTIIFMGPMMLFLFLMTINYSCDTSAAERHEAVIQNARGWITRSSRRHGGYNTTYHGEVVVSSWDSSKYPLYIKLRIPYERVGWYKSGEKAYVTTKKGFLGLAYSIGVEPASINVEKKDILSNIKRFSNKTNSKSVGLIRKNPHSDPKDPDFGKFKLTKREYEALSEKDKEFYKRRRKEIREFSNRRSGEVKPKLMGY